MTKQEKLILYRDCRLDAIYSVASEFPEFPNPIWDTKKVSLKAKYLFLARHNLLLAMTRDMNYLTNKEHEYWKQRLKGQTEPLAKPMKSALKSGWNRMVGWCIQCLKHMQFREQ